MTCPLLCPQLAVALQVHDGIGCGMFPGVLCGGEAPMHLSCNLCSWDGS